MSNEGNDPKVAPRLRGFAALTPERRRELARRGGQRAHELGRANKFSSEDASAAGRIPHLRGTAYRRPKRCDEAAAEPDAPLLAPDATDVPTAAVPATDAPASSVAFAGRGPGR